jgi:hypothetical protein
VSIIQFNREWSEWKLSTTIMYPLPVDSESWERSLAISSQTRDLVSSTSLTLSLDLSFELFTKIMTATIYHINCYNTILLLYKCTYIVLYLFQVKKDKYLCRA